MLALACSGMGVAPSLEHCMAHFSIDFTRIVGALLASPEGAHFPAGHRVEDFQHGDTLL
jgi:hypothetical protein